MRTMMTILIACAATLGIASASTSTSPPEAMPQVAPPTEGAIDDTEDTGYECRYSPYCRTASQCTAYCAGGIAVCERGCCACAS